MCSVVHDDIGELWVDFVVVLGSFLVLFDCSFAEVFDKCDSVDIGIDSISGPLGFRSESI